MRPILRHDDLGMEVAVWHLGVVHMKQISIAVLFTGALVVSAPLYALEDEVVLEPQTQNGVMFLSGGVGLDERAAMQHLQHQFTLWLSFEKEGITGHDSDTEVTIKDAKGTIVLETQTEGPWLMVKLPPGRYQVMAWKDKAMGKRDIVVSAKGVLRQVVHLSDRG